MITSQNLVNAYGGQMHVLSGSEGELVLADTCCGGDEEVGAKG